VDGARSEEILRRLNSDGAAIAAHFGLRYRAIEAERPRVKRRYGVCYADGTIRIRLRHAATGRPLKYSSLVNTLCHELAHLKHFNHGLRFQRLYRRILEWARAARIYRPGCEALAPLTLRAVGGTPAAAIARNAPRDRAARPVQLTLFGSADS
jgi:hypothetical protein